MPTPPKPPWWKVAIFGAFVPGADPAWRRQRLTYGAVGVMIGVIIVVVTHFL